MLSGAPSARATSGMARPSSSCRTSTARWSRLAEIDLGRFEGRSFVELERDEPEAYSRWLADLRSAAPPGGEAFARFQARVEAALADLRARERPTLVLTHAGVIRLMRHLAGGRSLDEELASPVEHLAPEPLPVGATSPRR